MADCVLFSRIGLHIPVLWALFWANSTSVIRKKDDLMSGTSHSPMATRERLLCSILSFLASLRFPNLTTQEESLQPLETYALCQGLIVFLSIYPWLKHEISIVTLMSLRTWGSESFRVITQQCALSSRNLPVDDTRANIFPVGCPNIPFLVPSCSNFMTTTDSLLTHFVHLLDLKFSYTKPTRLRNVSCQGKHLTASGQSF